jgi:hypothetical protein
VEGHRLPVDRLHRQLARVELRRFLPARQPPHRSGSHHQPSSALPARGQPVVAQDARELRPLAALQGRFSRLPAPSAEELRRVDHRQQVAHHHDDPLDQDTDQFPHTSTNTLTA